MGQGSGQTDRPRGDGRAGGVAGPPSLGTRLIWPGYDIGLGVSAGHARGQSRDGGDRITNQPSTCRRLTRVVSSQREALLTCCHWSAQSWTPDRARLMEHVPD